MKWTSSRTWDKEELPESGAWPTSTHQFAYIAQPSPLWGHFWNTPHQYVFIHALHSSRKQNIRKRKSPRRTNHLTPLHY